MAEFCFKKYVADRGKSDSFFIASAGVSGEETGNPVHYGTRKILTRLGIDCSEKTAAKIRKSDYSNYDYIIGMDRGNMSSLGIFFSGDKEHKLYSLLQFAGLNRDIADPWYTGDFEKTFDDITLGLAAFYQYLLDNKKV